MLDRLIVRGFKNATFVFDPVSQSSLFIEGTLADLVFNFLNNSDYIIKESYFSSIPLPWRKKAKEEIKLMRISVKSFLDKLSNKSSLRLKTNISTNDHRNSPMKRLSAYAVKNWQIINASIELTYRCNLRCQWCYLGDCNKKSLRRDYLQVITSHLKKIGTIFILFTGGEIFLRKDVFEIMNDFKDCRFALEVKSNGLLLNYSDIEKIADLNLFNLQISIYGIKDGYSSLVGNHYHFDRLTKNIREMVKQNIPLSLAVLVGKHNINELDRYDEMLRNLRVGDIFYSPYITPQRTGLGNAINFRLSREELDEKFYPFLDRINGFVEPVKYRDKCKNGPACYAGRDQIAIDPYGTIFPCLDLRVPLGHIRDDFNIILKERKKILRPYTLKKIRKCKTCFIVEYCDSCIGTALLESGKFTTPSQHKCDISRFYYDADQIRKEVKYEKV